MLSSRGYAAGDGVASSHSTGAWQRLPYGANKTLQCTSSISQWGDYGFEAEGVYHLNATNATLPLGERLRLLAPLSSGSGCSWGQVCAVADPQASSELGLGASYDYLIGMSGDYGMSIEDEAANGYSVGDNRSKACDSSINAALVPRVVCGASNIFCGGVTFLRDC